jgi:phosphatidylglycerophosphate synthase
VDLERPGQIFSLPNALTLVRLPLAGLLWIRPDDATWLIALAAIAAATDVADGRVARALRRRLDPERAAADQAVGAWLDPVCDKAFATSMLVAVAVGFDVSLGLLALALAREILFAPLMAIYHLSSALRETLHLDFSADRLGKLTTAVQFAVIFAVLLVPAAAWPLAIAAAVLGTLAVVHYAVRGVRRARAAARRGVGVGEIEAAQRGRAVEQPGDAAVGDVGRVEAEPGDRL